MQSLSHQVANSPSHRSIPIVTITIVGAGCFGTWTAYRLARTGHAVTLVDAYGAGNSRASSGGETRVIRMGYGAQEIYTRWSWRSLELWKVLFARHPQHSRFEEQRR